MPHSCPNCGHAALEQTRCPLCGWQPEPPPTVTHLLVGDQVVTLHWQMVSGVPIGDPVATQSFWAWIQRRRAR